MIERHARPRGGSHDKGSDSILGPNTMAIRRLYRRRG